MDEAALALQTHARNSATNALPMDAVEAEPATGAAARVEADAVEGAPPRRRIIVTGAPAGMEEADFSAWLSDGSDREAEEASRPSNAPAAAAPNASHQSRRAQRLTASWAALDAVDLRAEFRIRTSVMQGVPAFMRGPLRNAYRTAFTSMHDHRQPNASEPQFVRA